VRRPGDRVGLARDGRVLDQVLLAGAFLQNAPEQLARRVELVVAREDDRGDLFLAVALGDQIAADDLQPAIALPHLFPKVGGAMHVLVHRVSAAPWSPG